MNVCCLSPSACCGSRKDWDLALLLTTQGAVAWAKPPAVWCYLHWQHFFPWVFIKIGLSSLDKTGQSQFPKTHTCPYTVLCLKVGPKAHHITFSSHSWHGSHTLPLSLLVPATPQVSISGGKGWSSWPLSSHEAEPISRWGSFWTVFYPFLCNLKFLITIVSSSLI